MISILDRPPEHAKAENGKNDPKAKKEILDLTLNRIITYHPLFPL